ncbi:MAG: hypothetical protein WAW36_10725 [Methylovulum miyakonense]|uniref:hypothetical protein n=1 Tax=Methylovulum miyakonense TaxID=645578 RepID=UPI003BB673C3
MKFSKKTHVLTSALLAMLATSVLAEGLGDNVIPAPPSIGSVVPLTYFGPAPSSVNPSFIGPHQLLTAGKVNINRLTVTLPLYKAVSPEGETYWYVLTDSNDQANSEALGLNFSGKLTYAETGRGVRHATQQFDGTVKFTTAQAGVDFAPRFKVVPGDAPNLFPPKEFKPGSIGQDNYSPLMKIDNVGGYIYNAPIVAKGTEEQLNAFCDANPDKRLVHDKTRRICPAEGTVELKLTLGFTFSRPLLYLSLEASHELPATMEQATFAPGLQDIGVGRDDSAFSAVERLFAVVNGPMGKDNPQRQGFNSALAGEGGPLNVLGGIPTVATDYSPLWDINAVEWTADAIKKGYRSRVLGEFELLGLVQQGWLTGPGGAKFGSTGFIVNCPPVMRLL